MSNPYNGHKELLVWRTSYELSKTIYALTRTLPKEEAYGLTSQIRRAAISIPSNIAEGYRRIHARECLRFARIAYGSATELETQISLIKDMRLGDVPWTTRAEKELDHVLRLLNGYCAYLQSQVNVSFPRNHVTT